ncbi:NAD(P)/FAD-dependent oxidoreductase [Halorubrum vacuolatum]|uniref:Sarcosine oxidase subunit beta n=1 Tax=Halorubrum vacuolatum TaxID=63740 RepID=A0A238ULD8_HALVU|nr:FAD-binding oxidoreductase [Halorubrum vacuolatum]SNR22858.1 sarcosine oxidase subunit beta [Halorubrum vacuolatum]
MHAVVIGGGIVGVATAHALAEREVAVTLLERDALGTGSTARSAGGIRTQFSTPVNVRLSLASLPVWETFEERFDVDIGFHQHGYLFLARTDATAARFEEAVGMQRGLGVDVELLSPAEAAAICPGLRADRFVAATYNPRDGYADPNLAVQGFAAAARERGAELRTGVAVRDLHLEGGRIVGVETTEGRIDADMVINAAGAWAGHVVDPAGRSLPIAPRRRQIAVVKPGRGIPADLPLTIDMDAGSYFRPEGEDTALVGGHAASEDPDVDPDAYPTSMNFEEAVGALERAADYTTYFDGDTRLVRGWAGLYAVTPDRHPIIEETAPGLYTVAGFSGHGFQHAPAAARCIAEIALDGEAAIEGVESLSSDRFEDEDGPVEQNVA